ncbi:MAG: VOC family protein [Omnitrophica WOR_2 bacterium]
MTTHRQKITPHLWFDREAREAADLYTSIFKDSRITNTTTLHDTPSGSAEIVSFELSGMPFMAISAGPLFKFNPSISFTVACATKEEVDDFWNKLSEGGQVLMELGEYPFNQRYGWAQDRYGLSWQVTFAGDHPIQQKITPMLMFVGEQAGKAGEAIRFYESVFPNSKTGSLLLHGKGEEPDKEGTVKYAAFTLAGQEFAAMDSAFEHQFSFNEAISFMINCDTQAEIDTYWDKLSAIPEAEQCGWLKDRYGLSWQVTPVMMAEMMRKGTPQQIARLTEAFLPMKKFDLAVLKKAYEGR